MPAAERPTSDQPTDRLDRSLFAAHYSGVYGRLWILAASILGDEAGAEDIVQESALAAWTKRDQFQPGTNFGAWMARFVRWHAFNYARKRAGRHTFPTDPTDMDKVWVTDPTPDTEIADDARGEIKAGQHQFDDDVVRALRSVAPICRACLLLRTVHELSYREIADLLGIPEGTAMSHVHRTRSLIRDRLRPESPRPNAGNRNS